MYSLNDGETVWARELSFVIWDLFDLWNLTNFIWEPKVRLYQYAFCKLHMGRNPSLRCKMRLTVSFKLAKLNGRMSGMH